MMETELSDGKNGGQLESGDIRTGETYWMGAVMFRAWNDEGLI